jgi:GT2 family glycosyltransferase
MDVSIIVPTLNRDDVLLQTLVDLGRQTGIAEYEIVVVDQNPMAVAQRNSALAEIAARPNVKWITCTGRGVVFARNLAVNRSQGEVLVFVDDDVGIPDSEFLLKHLTLHRELGQGVAAICGRETNPGGREFSEAISYPRSSPMADILFFPRNYRARVEACVLSTCNCSIKRTAFLAVSGFDERFAGASYGDDTDLALRLVEHGFKILYDPDPVLLHLMWPMGGLRFSDRRNPFAEDQKYVSSMVFYLKHVVAHYPQYRAFYVYNYLFRKSLLLRRNVLHPWRLPIVGYALLRSRIRAGILLKTGHEYSFA